jgi:hypothetical protein
VLHPEIGLKKLRDNGEAFSHNMQEGHKKSEEKIQGVKERLLASPSKSLRRHFIDNRLGPLARESTCIMKHEQNSSLGFMPFSDYT